ncbi:type II 3-dehydroquinate dehydratase [Candidatus Aerophobetes bacterium]|uniref:3-dehydroquinate dehydratase n=1 Tax=Aerophobetes bacterium TaxID=2030807 RepID=A0A523V210_UNCAE|nr:MAG: type II 3-dehydroquinate dehydratase [Candidatus Aerophobetes bacterium]
MIHILIIHGPNIDLLGMRERNIYGKMSLSRLNQLIRERAKNLGVEVKISQSNHEGDIVSLIGKSKNWADAIIINPAAYTHTSVAIRDAILAVKIPTIEVHLSNIYQREAFRQRSLTAGACLGLILGLGSQSYLLALEGAVNIIKEKSKKCS